MYVKVKFNCRNITLNNFFDSRPFSYVKMDFKLGKKYRGFSKCIKGKNG
jgi:hypothetical protein